MVKRLILFVGVYDTLDIFTYELNKSFKAMNYETLIFNSANINESLAALGGFIKKPVTAAITFNNLGFNMELTPGKNIWEDLGIPIINILMDHPFCYKKALDNAPSNAIVLCVDRNHMRYLNRFYPNIAITGYLPHGGKISSSERKAIVDRKYDVIYAGNLSRQFADNITPDLSQYEFDAEALCRKVYDNAIANPYKTTEEVIEEELLAIGLQPDADRLCQLISELHFIDLHIVSYYREKVVETVARSGLKLLLCGAGWENCDWIGLPNIEYAGKIPAEDVVVKMADAKIVLSTMTWFKDGTHDRIFNGMLQGAISASDSSLYMKEEFTSGKDMLLFELDEIDKLPGLLKDILSDASRAQAIADTGYKKALEFHTWDARAKELHNDLLVELGGGKKILAITHQLSRTGAPIVFLDMLRFYAKLGYQIDVISMLDGELRDEYEEAGFNLTIQDHFYKDKDKFLSLACHYDCVIANTLITYEVVHCLNGSHIPLIWWLHEGEQYFEYFKTVIPDFNELKANVHVYAVGHYVKDVIKKRYNADVDILHFSVEDSCPSDLCRKEPEDRVKFLIAGTYSKVKGQDILAEAIRALPSDYLKRCEFYFCGNEEMVDDEVYQAFVSLEKDFSNVNNLHKLSRSQTLEQMRLCDCLLVPSRIDPIPTVAVEMMMMKGLCLCTDICGIAHYIIDGENGYTVAPNDAKALSDKICHIIDHKDTIVEIGKNGRAIYDRHFSGDVIEKQLAELISLQQFCNS